MKILITGTPGVGKTTLSAYLATETAAPAINVGDFIEGNALYSRVSKTYQSMVYDPRRVRRALKRELAGKASFIIDTHDPEVVSFVDFDLVVVLTMGCRVLAARYEERGYPEKKISENLEAEIMQVVYNDVVEHLCRSPDDVEKRVLVVEGECTNRVLSVAETCSRISQRLSRMCN